MWGVNKRLPTVIEPSDPWYPVFNEINKLTNTDITKILDSGIRRNLIDLPK